MTNVVISVPFTDKASELGGLTVGAEVASMPGSNLLDQRLSKRWRTPDLNAKNSVITFDASVFDPMTRQNFSGGGSDFDSVWAVFMPGDISINAEIGVRNGVSRYERVVPNGVTLTNATGAYTDIDEDPYSLDGSRITGSTSGVTTSVTVDFVTPAQGPSVGSRNQLFRVAILSNDSGAGATIDVTVSLREGAGDLVSETFTIPTDGSLEILQFAWGAESLGTVPSSGAAVQCHIEATDATFDVDAVDWLALEEHCNWTPVFSTGDFQGVSANATFPYSGPVPNHGPIAVRVADSNVGRLNYTVYFRDCYRGLSQHSYGHDYGSWIQVRRLFLARDTSLTATKGSRIRVVDPSQSATNPRTGAQFFGKAPKYREFDLTFDNLTNAEAYQKIFHTVDRGGGVTRDVGVAFSPPGANAHDTTIYGQITPADIGFEAAGFDLHDRTINVRERVR